MKRKLCKIIFILIALITITGCSMKENLHMVISSNKSVKVSIITAMDDEMIDTMISMDETGEIPSSIEKKEYTDEERWKYLEKDENSTLNTPEDYTVKKYDKDGFKGYISEKDFGSIDKISSTNITERQNILSDNNIFGGILFIKNGNEYTSNMKVDLSEEDEDFSSYESYGAVFDMKLVIELPRVPASHNADEISKDGKTLTWDLLKTQDIEFTFNFDKDGTILTRQEPKTEDTETLDKNEKQKLLLIFSAIVGAILLGIVALIIVIILVIRWKHQPIQINLLNYLVQQLF